MGLQWGVMDDLVEAVHAAAGRAEVIDAVERVYADLQRAIDERKPLCSMSGRCCRFEEFDHRLYVTTLELAAFVRGLREEPSKRDRLQVIESWDGRGCPFQVSGLCGVHAIRPFGCRVFFCDPSAEAWQQAQYERFHAELKQMHERLGVRYLYVEWRAALRALGLAPGGMSGS